MAETIRDEITHLAGSIRALQRELEVALAKRRVELNYKVHDWSVSFEHLVIARYRLLSAASWTSVTLTPSGTTWSVFGRRRDP
jgi:hypothetical protein